MNINRNNYEEYFLLLIDKELSLQKMQAVMDFAEKNPDLKTELELLLNTVISKDENIVFAHKHSLLKDESHISDEQLLLYLDDELSDSEKNDIEKDQDFVLQRRITNLKKVYNEPDLSVVFEKKENLYRHRRVASLKLWKVAAAASVIIAFFAVMMFRNNGRDKARYVSVDKKPNVSGFVRNDTLYTTTDNVSSQPIANSKAVFAKNKKQVKISVAQPKEFAVGWLVPDVRGEQVIASVSIKNDINIAPKEIEIPDNNIISPVNNEKEQALTEFSSNEPANKMMATNDRPKKDKKLFKKFVQKMGDKITNSIADEDGKVTISGFEFTIR